MFFHLKQTGWTPKVDIIYTIKFDGEFHPCTYQREYVEGRNTTNFGSFIRGTGWKNSKKGYKIPVYKGTTKEEWESYLSEYGKYCLFFSITGFQLGSDDCVVWAAQQEFNVTLGVGYDYMEGFLGKLNDLNSKIQKIVMDKYKLDIFHTGHQWHGGKYSETSWIISERDLFVVRPQYSLMAYFLTKPHIDPVSDDSKLWKHFVNVIGHNNLDEMEKEFPVSVRDRLTYLFSKEVSDDYEKLMKAYPIG